MVNMAGADSVINCWDDKAFWNFWRPITAIREGDADGNDKTAGDPAWTSLVPAPPYADHPSGYNCVTGGFMHAAEAFFGKGKQPFAVTANVGSPPAPVTREYERFTDVIDDTIDARIYLGIHFRTPDEQGAGIGKDVAHWLDKHYFRPVVSSSLGPAAGAGFARLGRFPLNRSAGGTSSRRARAARRR